MVWQASKNRETDRNGNGEGRGRLMSIACICMCSFPAVIKANFSPRSKWVRTSTSSRIRPQCIQFMTNELRIYLVNTKLHHTCVKGQAILARQRLERPLSVSICLFLPVQHRRVLISMLLAGTLSCCTIVCKIRSICNILAF